MYSQNRLISKAGKDINLRNANRSHQKNSENIKAKVDSRLKSTSREDQSGKRIKMLEVIENSMSPTKGAKQPRMASN